MGIPRDKAEFAELLALTERRHGRWKDALNNAKTAVELDPHNHFTAIELLESLIALRQFKEAEEFADSAIKQFPPDYDVLSIYRSYCRLGLGKLAEARSVLETAPVRTDWGTDRLIQLAIFARDLDRASALPATLPAEKKYSMPWEGIIARMRGDQEKARQYYNGAVDYYQKVLAQRADDLFTRDDLSLAYAALGRKEEAIREANSTRYGLLASVWTADNEKGRRLARRIEAGTVIINDAIYTHGAARTPWFGVKESGLGVTHGDAGLFEFTRLKHVNWDLLPLKSDWWWFPYTPRWEQRFKSLMKLLYRLGLRKIA